MCPEKKGSVLNVLSKLIDETNYIYHCSFFKRQRKEYLEDLSRLVLEALFNNQKLETVFRLAKFINYSMRLFK